MDKNKIKYKVEKLPKSIIEIKGEIEADAFEEYYKKAFQKLSKNIEVDGFRKGKVPEKILLEKVPEPSILEEMAQMALNDYYPEVIKGIDMDIISSPKISITKLARKNPFGFKITTAILPEFDLPNYKKIAKETKIDEKDKEIEVTDKEIENTIMDIRKSRAKKENMQNLVKKEAETKKEKTKSSKVESPKKEKTKEPELPELNDEFVKSMGPFKDVKDFKEKLKENIKLEKKNKAREIKRLKIIENILKETEVEVPEILIDTEVQKTLYRMETDITAMGLKFDTYLEQLKKTREDLAKEFRSDAKKKAKLGLLLNKIAKDEKIIPDEKEVEKEVNHILEHYKDADKKQAKVYAENVLVNEKIFQLLESQ